PAPLSPGAKRGLLAGLIAVGAIIVLAVVGTVAVSMINASRGPEAAATTYLNHIAQGDASAANAMVDPDVPNSDRAFLSDEVLAAATERISDIEVTALGSGGSDSTYVEVSYKLDGVTQTTQLGARKGEPEFLFLDTWTITSSLATPVNVGAVGLGEVSIGGVTIPLSDDGWGYRSADLVMYPGVYPVEAEESAFFELEETVLRVGSRPEPTEPFTFTATDALVESVQEQVNALIDSCLEQTVAEPEGCPFYTWVYPSDTAVTWTLGEYPTVTVSEDGSSFEATDGTVIATYTEMFFGTSSEERDER